MPTAGQEMPTGFFVFGPIMWIVFALIIRVLGVLAENG